MYAPQETSDRVLGLLKASVPKLSVLAVLTNPANSVQRELMASALPAAAQRANVTLVPVYAQSVGDFAPAFDLAAQKGANAVYVLVDVLTFIHRALIAELAARSRLPAVYGLRGAAEVGGFMAYGPDLRDLFRRAGSYVDKILKGAKPGDMPVERSAKYDLLINLKAARALGLTVPAGVIRQANEVIE
jgi:putative ABC transport system substrate-binding protein